MSLDTPLIDRTYNDRFGITREELMDWFVASNRIDDNGEISISRNALSKLGDQEGLLKVLDTKINYGFEETRESLLAREVAFGNNHRRTVETKSIWDMVMEQFEDKILRILLAAALVSLVIGIYQEGIQKGWIEGLTIYIAISVIVIVTVANDYAKEKQFQKLMEAKEDQYCAVIRNGDFINISIYKLLVGDLVQIMEGDSVPADIVLIQGTKITADEANITGEPEHLTKTAL